MRFAVNLSKLVTVLRGWAVIEATAKSVLPDISWIIRDLSDLCESPSVARFFGCSFDVVVNCAGALQESYRDDLDGCAYKSDWRVSKVHVKRLMFSVVQISSVGAVLKLRVRLFCERRLKGMKSS